MGIHFAQLGDARLCTDEKTGTLSGKISTDGGLSVGDLWHRYDSAAVLMACEEVELQVAQQREQQQKALIRSFQYQRSLLSPWRKNLVRTENEARVLAVASNKWHALTRVVGERQLLICASIRKTIQDSVGKTVILSRVEFDAIAPFFYGPTIAREEEVGASSAAAGASFNGVAGS
ncbi:hypothetical protein [Terriglobus roseus]|uniref:Uncharacterized protein n=1 Tax=Terriglobus roseus TaxID=392734 RepID=A0A1H4K1J1_9BACT|nr:hypothetical protein [Terriglobus roseus]SEB51995.1 hypothetical protein SAMN05443244_0932 [Terriglobus roseus]